MQTYIPNEISEGDALKRATHLAICAHQDDIEINMYDAVFQCFGKRDKWLVGVVVTDGAGSARSGIYADFTNEDMIKIREVEQKKAANVGEYSAQIFLDHPSSAAKSPQNREIIDELKQIITETNPDYIYTHNLADKHDTHVGVAVKVIIALRELNYKPKAVYGCEGWRDLDWMADSDKVKFNVEGRPNLERALMGVFDSQISGGKNYDKAAMARRLVNATFSESHSVDETTLMMLAMDLTPLIEDITLDITEFTAEHVRKFEADVVSRLKKLY